MGTYLTLSRSPVHPVFLLLCEEQDWTEKRGQVYLIGCASEYEEQSVQRFVVGVEDVEVTSALPIRVFSEVDSVSFPSFLLSSKIID